MSHEYPAEELTACTCCGIEMPQDMMTFLDDGQVLCPDCYDRMMNSLGNLVDEPLPTYADNASTTGMILPDWHRTACFSVKYVLSLVFRLANW